MACTAALVALAASPLTHSSDALYYIALLNAVPQAGAYPAVTKLVCASFEPDQRADVFALVSLGSRAGSVAVSLVIGEVLRRSNDWRVAVRVAPLAVLGAMALVALAGNPSPSASRALAPTSPRSASSSGSPRAGSSSLELPAEPFVVRLGRLACNPRFWLVNVGSAMLLISKGFETHAVSYISDVCEAAHAEACSPGASCVCKGYAPQVTACLSLGIVASLLLGSFVWGKLTTKAPRAAFIVLLCALNLAAALLLYAVTHATFTHGSPPLGPASPERHTLFTLGGGLFCIGLSAGYPFYMPQSLFAVEFGDRDAATVVGCGECLQSVFAYAFICTAQRFMPLPLRCLSLSLSLSLYIYIYIYLLFSHFFYLRVSARR
jgi:sugar phosphate permease